MHPYVVLNASVEQKKKKIDISQYTNCAFPNNSKGHEIKMTLTF